MTRASFGLLLLLAAACECSGGVPFTPPLPGSRDGGPDGQSVACDDDDDCPLGRRCVEEACVAVDDDIVDEGCRSDGDCGDGQLCAVATGRCVVDAPTPGVPVGPAGACNDGDQRSCGEKIGACDYGVELCAAGAWAGVCTGAIGPTEEACNSLDDDCDGAVDEDHPGVGAPCTAGLGACSVTGFTVCTADGAGTTCTAEALDATGRVERCGDGIDDDCDGTPDDGFEALGDDCFVGDPDDPCRAQGTFICSPDGLALACDVAVTDELCNGVDDNDNGCVDEGFPFIGCTRGIGECARAGMTVCTDDGLDVTCGAVPGTPAGVETCDGDDDDCNTIDDDGCDDDDDDYCDGTLAFAGAPAICPKSTSATVLDCNDGNGSIRPDGDEVCNNAVDEDCDGALNNGCAACDPEIDADFDGVDQCDDCDDGNGAVFPTAIERCNGLDENCNGQFDEAFDLDGDGFTTCGTGAVGGLDPARADCNDTPGAGETIHPTACELCANASGPLPCGDPGNDRGNDVDEDCDGFTDELCRPCSDLDPDGDGDTECEGDCAVNDPAVNPGQPEVCDGKDTDCNRTTVENCDVGDPCNFAALTDACKEDLLCVEGLRGGGQPSGIFTCTSLCNTTPGDVLGDSCDLDETCRSGLTPSENLHGCGVTEDFGAAVAGATCSSDAQCRSGRCRKDSRFGGNTKYCIDFCASADYCPPGTECMVEPSFEQPPTVFFATSGHCLRLQAGQDIPAGASCTAATAEDCIHGSYACFDPADPVSGTARRCHAPCCAQSSCDADERCAFIGNEFASPNFGVDAVPFCTPKSAGNGGRPSGAACSESDECAGEFCDEVLGVCVDPCCNDGACPAGQQCEAALTILPSGAESFARMCLSFTPADPLEAR